LACCETLETDSFGNDNFLDLVNTAVGVITLVHPPSQGRTQQIALDELEREMSHRLNFPWLLPKPILRMRVALVRGRPSISVGGRVYSAAEALGIDLVIVDEEGHWLQPDNDSNRRHREAFLTIDMSEDSGLSGRIAAALAAYPLPVDGLFTLSDNYLVAVAQAAESLGMPTSPVSAHQIAIDKYLTRLVQADQIQHVQITGSEEMQELTKRRDDAPPEFVPKFPLVIKPRTGWSSEYVSKASNMTELFCAIEQACATHPEGAVVETYLDGPEIDVNFVLYQGETVFCEVVDELPSDGDSEDATVRSNFLESGMMLPAILPTKEKEIAVSSLKDILIRLGFHTGVFHVEARITGSKKEYRKVDGVTDLVAKEHSTTEKIQCHLIEINARPPGLIGTVTTAHTYGVDLFIARILSAVGDVARLKALCIPFTGTGLTDGAQCWTQIVFLPVLKGEILKSSDACIDLVSRYPDLAPFVADAEFYHKPGDRIPDPERAPASFLGHILIVSRRSRRHLMSVAEEVRRKFVVEVETNVES
jgi:D-alanine-D-alanine ligase-like ATP-grasp enzyme